MNIRTADFRDVGEHGLTDARVAGLVDEHARVTQPRLRMLWAYYRNALVLRSSEAGGGLGVGGGAGGRAYRLAQERGLPARIVRAGASGGAGSLAADDRGAARREIVVENDIAWRIHAMVDFLFSKPVRLVSAAADPAKRTLIQRVLDEVWEVSGGAALLQDIALLGHVYGHVDLVVRAASDLAGDLASAAGKAEPVDAARVAAGLRIEPIEPSRGVPVIDPRDYRSIEAYLIRTTIDTPERGRVAITEVLSGTRRHVYEEEQEGAPAQHQGARGPAGRGGDAAGAHGRASAKARLVLDEPNTVCPGEVPVVHIQNISQPFAYAGLSDVEPLIPLQDELNTRLSDRANRVTLQSFKMYLAKGIEGFDKQPVGPGQLWMTDNPHASIEAFGGDAASPSEDRHIEQVRDAMDKASSLPPLATGVVQAKVGNLTSENALRLTLGGVLTRTNRKRLLYGRGIAQACRLVLSALDDAGVLRTSEEDRRVKVEWSDPLPQTAESQLQTAKAKLEVGIDAEQVRTELGYGVADEGVV
ncbi:MAG: phage portal protein [Phycisphaerales bacterium]